MNYWQGMPANLIATRIFIAGGAFRMKHRFQGGNEKHRIFFILKNVEQSDAYLYLVTASSEVERRRKLFCNDEKALVVIRPSEYNALTCESLVDCGSPIPNVNKDRLIAKIENHEIQPLPCLPTDVLQRLREATASSKRLASGQKKLLLGEAEATGHTVSDS